MTEATVIFGNPGSGKTTALAQRFSDELATYAADEMVFLSYTKAAARETLSKIDGLGDIGGACTIHSLCYRLSGISSQQVITTKMLVGFGNKIGYSLRGQDSLLYDVSEGDEYLALYSLSLNRRQDPMFTYSNSHRPGTARGYKYFIESYQSWKKVYGYVDFDDMLQSVIDLKPEHNYRVIFVDEAQDLSCLQWGAIRAIAKGCDKITAVGDPRQSLFLWGGADREGMYKFEKEYKAKRVVLGKSYRVPRKVATVAYKVAKDLQWGNTGYEPRDADGKVTVYGDIDSIRWDSRDTLVLYRTHYLRKEIERSLVLEGIPYTVEAGKPGIMSSRGYRAIVVWEKFGATGEIDDRGKALVLEFARYSVTQALDSGRLETVRDTPWNRAMLLPDNVVSFKNAMKPGDPNIRLSTVHGSKGREADRVVLLTAQTQRTVEGAIRDPRAEAMVWYVGVTRARESLDIVRGDLNYGMAAR